jgi:hypothetical protein
MLNYQQAEEFVMIARDKGRTELAIAYASAITNCNVQEKMAYTAIALFNQVDVSTLDEVDRSYTLLTSGQDIAAALDAVGLEHLLELYGSLMVYASGGEYLQIWGCETSVPKTDSQLELVYDHSYHGSKAEWACF